MSQHVINEVMALTNLERNQNSIWKLRWYEDGRLEIEKGRVGSDLALKSEQGYTREQAIEMIERKKHQGFHPIALKKIEDMESPDMDMSRLHPKVEFLLKLIMNDATEDINSWLRASIGDLDQEQLHAGREWLNAVITYRKEVGKLSIPAMIGIANEYYSLIPTKLAFSRSTVANADYLMQNIEIEMSRLDQLEAAIAINKSSHDPLEALNNVKIGWLDYRSSEFEFCRDRIEKTADGYRVAEAYSIEIPGSKARYDNCDKGNKYIQTLFHGTKPEYVQHILRIGLRKPYDQSQVKSGDRFGKGIYFADYASRSLSYAGYGDYRTLFLCDVKLGNQRHMNGMNSSIQDAGEGYDSVHGGESYSGLDEFIVYDNGQADIRYLALVKRA